MLFSDFISATHRVLCHRLKELFPAKKKSILFAGRFDIL
jgi:hypothetical protein